MPLCPKRAPTTWLGWALVRLLHGWGSPRVAFVTIAHLPTLNALLAEVPPPNLFHYTGPGAVLAILESQTLLAGRAGDMNDAKEQEIGVDIVDNYAMNTLNVRRPADEEDCAFLEVVRRKRYEANRQVFTVSLTSERDALDQWRAYCPRSGGVAMAFPTDHLKGAAEKQGFFLARCTYDWNEQYRLVSEIVDHHFLEFQRARKQGGADPEQLMTDHARVLAAHVARFAPLLKHGTFSGEREWRLVSLPRSNEPLKFLPSDVGIKVYREFKLFPPGLEAIPAVSYPSDGQVQGFGYVIGPNVDNANMSYAVQMAYHQHLGQNFWMTGTSSTYR